MPPVVTSEELATIGLIAEAYLGHLGVDDLLGEITRRLAGVLNVDAAVVLLHEARSGQLVARAAYGLEEEVRQGVRVRVGEGFAGLIAARGLPMTLDGVDKTTVISPLLWEKGIEAMLGVPLLDGEEVIGVLHVGSLTPRSFSDEDVRSLQYVADHLVSAVLNRGATVERVMAQVLQRSLLPSVLPECPGLRFATRYVAAETGGVGGDWYDAFRLPTNGQLWVMVGDVGGHGLLPAVIMGRLRSALRSYALEGHGPEEVLLLADRKLQFFEPGFLATVLIAVLDPPYGQARLVSAGHLPPILAAPGAAPVLVPVPVRAPLGVGTDVPVRAASIDLPPGASLLAFTDGLVERRGESLDLGLQRLVEAMRADDPEDVCRDVMEALIGRSVPQDDIALLALQRS